MPAYAETEKYEEMILDVEFTPSSGIYTPICGLSEVTISRTANVDEDEIPPCDDESLPMSVEVSVRSVTTTVSGTGKWAKSSQSALKNWLYGGQPLNIRLRDTAATSGDVETESGPAVITSLNNTRTKGVAVSAEMEFRFNGIPTLTDAS